MRDVQSQYDYGYLRKHSLCNSLVGVFINLGVIVLVASGIGAYLTIDSSVFDGFHIPVVVVIVASGLFSCLSMFAFAAVILCLQSIDTGISRMLSTITSDATE